jgi:DNA-binding MarR family transcriptional regulator
MVKLLEEDRENFLVRIADLHALDEVGFPDADLAKRKLNREHVATLKLSDENTWPPILITSTDQGYVVIDGYHREEAAKGKGRDEIRATCRTYASEKDVIEACFEANMKHGLNLAPENRSNYAYWLHKTYPEMTQKEIAQRAHIRQSTVSIAIARREGTQEPTEEAQEEAIRKTCQRLTNDATKLLEEINKLPEQNRRAAIINNIDVAEDRANLLKMAEMLEAILRPAARRRR